MTDGLTPERFNVELRDWVQSVTGRSIGAVGVVSRATAYRLTDRSNLIKLPDLVAIIEKCAPSSMSPAERDALVASWRRKWEQAQAYAASTRTPPPPAPLGDTAVVPVPRAATPLPARLQFPRARVAQLRDPDLRQGTERLATLLDDWGAQTSSNLFFLSGASGSGKTTEALDWVHRTPGASYVSLLERSVDLARLADGEGRAVVVIDDFDLVSSRVDRPGERPDLSELKPFFARGGRCVVLSKRNLQTDRDELAEQLNSPGRLDALGAVNPVVVRVQPIAAADLRSLAGTLNDPRLASLAAFVGRSGDPMMVTPMVLKQLYATHEGEVSDTKTIRDSYATYLNYVCGKPWDDNISRISGRMRFDIYTDLAWDIFSGGSASRRRLAISVAQITRRVDMHTRKIRRRSDAYEHDWVFDLLDHVDVFGIAGRATDSEELAEFAHVSLYEFFVADAIRLKLARAEPLGLDEKRFTQMTMDSFVMTFLKASLTADDFDAIADLCGVDLPDGLTWLDRAICLYLSEEHPRFATLLEGAPESYWENLERVDDFQSLFLRKLTAYQRVVAGRLDPDEYINLIEQEEPEAVRIEQGLLSSDGSVTRGLVKRLQNDALRRAAPITIYRLGQLADVGGIEPLRAFGAERPDLRERVDEAVKKLESRAAQVP